MAYDKTEQENLKSLGAKIRHLREEKGMSQMGLGFKANLDRTYIGSIERGERNISVLNLIKIADALEVHVTMLFTWMQKKQ